MVESVNNHLKQIQVLFVPEIALHKAPLAPHETALAKASTPPRSRASCGPNNKGRGAPEKKSRKRPRVLPLKKQLRHADPVVGSASG